MLAGYLTKLEQKGPLKTRKRRWFVFAEESNQLFYYKSHRDTTPLGKIDIATAVLTYDVSDASTGSTFELRCPRQTHILEAPDQRTRLFWLEQLQCKRRAICESKNRNLAHSLQNPINPGSGEPLINQNPPSLGPLPDFSEITEQVQKDCIESIMIPPDPSSELPNSTFYVSSASQLDSTPPKPISSNSPMPRKGSGGSGRECSVSPDSGKKRGLIKFPSLRQRLGCSKPCEYCVELISVIDNLKQRCTELTDELAANKDLLAVLKNAVVLYKNQIETLKKMVTEQNTGPSTSGSVSTELGNNPALSNLLLQKEKLIAHLEAQSSEYRSEIIDLKEQIRSSEAQLEGKMNEGVVFRRSCRHSGGDERSSGDYAYGVEASDLSSSFPTETSVVDLSSKEVEELRDIIKGYRAQNQFLNKEVLELHGILQNCEHRERMLTKSSAHHEASYYQLKSKYLLLLNHVRPKNEDVSVLLNQDVAMTRSTTIQQLIEDATNTLEGSGKHEDVDNLGFYDPTRKPSLEDEVLTRASRYQQKHDNIVSQKERNESYLNWLTAWDTYLVAYVKKPLKWSEELKELIRTGIPHSYRTTVWKSMINWYTQTIKDEMGKGYFGSLHKATFARRDTYDPALKQIDLDLARTLPTNQYFETLKSEKIEMLRKVLYAFRWHNKEVGYCQGLNRVAAVALLYLDEEDAFWALVTIVDHLQPQGYYEQSMIAPQVDQRVLKELVQEKLPKIANHFSNLDVDLSLFTFNWFLTIFVDNVPHTTYLNIWDVFLSEGHKVLFRFTLAALKLFEVQILNFTTTASLQAFLSDLGQNLDDFGKLAHIAFNDLNPFPMKGIEAKRVNHLAQVKAEMSAFQDMRKSLHLEESNK